jgi:hypothetical protein
MNISRDADLLQAAREMIVAIHQATSPNQRHRLLQQITSLLTDENFPALIKLFVIVGESDDAFAKKSLAEALADTLVRGDVPSAPLAAWGSASIGLAAQARGFSAGARLDPLQYLCAWYTQTNEHLAEAANPPLSPNSFSRALEALIAVFADQPNIANKYRGKLNADLHNSQDGALSTTTQKILKLIIEDWEQGLSPRLIAERASGTRQGRSNIADLARAQMLGLNMAAPKKERP